MVLVTGATGGLGRVVTRSFASDGARLALTGTDEGRLRALASDVGLPADRWVPVVVDLRDRDAARDALAAAEASLGGIDIVVHLVGGYTRGTPIAELDPADVAGMLDQHLWTTLHVTQAVVPGMVERGWGRVLAVSPPIASEPASSTPPCWTTAARAGTSPTSSRR